MPAKETNGIEMIQQGRIDYYVPLHFETSNDFEELCNKINSTVNESISNHLSNIQSELQDLRDSIQDNIHSKVHGKLPFTRTFKKWIRDRRAPKQKYASRANDDTSLELFPTASGLKISMTPGEIQAYTDRHETLDIEFEQYKKIYGIGFVNSQQRYILWPLNVQLVSGEFVWVNAVLYIFKNMMGILKLELPLVNVPSQPLMDLNYDAYIKSIDDKWGLMPTCINPTIEDLRNAYIQTITNKNHLTIVVDEGVLTHVILARYDGMPKQIHNIPVDVQEDLYKIIAAPVPEIGCASYRQTARECIEKQSWGYHNMKYILSTTGRCLSIVDTTLIDWLNQHYKEHWKVDTLDNDALALIDQRIIRDLCINAEFALMIPLLKHLNSTYVYIMKRIKPEDVHDVQMKYNLNLMFISQMQESCYGSASEQVEAFERLMPYYLKEKIVNEKMQAIDRLLKDEESQRYEKLQNFLSISGLIMALVFGLPAIYETFKIIRGICVFIPYDIPILTITNTSVGVWIILIIALVFNILCSRKVSRKKTILI